MIHRLAILIGSVAAAGILALGFLATGLGPRAATADAEQATAVGASDTSLLPGGRADALSTPKPVTRVETTTVYVRPAPKPKVIHVTRRAPAAAVQHAPKAPKARPVHRERDDDGGGERGDD